MKKEYEKVSITVISMMMNEDILYVSGDGEDMDAADLLGEEIQDYLDNGSDNPRA